MSRRSLRINALVAATTVLFVVANAVWSVHRDYESTVAEHEIMARDLTSVVADQAARSVKDTDRTLRQIGDMVQSGGGLAVFKEKREWEALRRITDQIPGGTGVLLADPRGNVVANSVTQNPSPASVAAHDYMQVLTGTDVLRIGGAILSKINEDEIVYTISRRINDSQGNFIGVVSAGIATSHLTEFYDLLGFKKDPGIAVFRGDGDIIARRPNVREYIGKSIAERPLFQVRLKQSNEGVFRAESPMDGIDRMNAYKRVNGTGLVVLVGIPWDAVTAEWRDRTWRIGAIALLSVVVIILAALWGSVSIRRTLQAQTEREEALIAKERAHQALHQALHDHLTGLPARALFLEQADNLRSHSRRNGDGLAFMIIDMDGFKDVNDTGGHEKGDEVLVKAAAILRAALGDTDVAGRLGGDEFGVCIAAPADLIGERAGSIAGQIVDRIGAIGMGIGCSVGVAICTAACEGLSSALRKADEAMYRAKRNGKERFAIWEPARQGGKESANGMADGRTA